jgi:hypothetical protein
MFSLYQKERDILIIRNGQLRLREFGIDLVKINLIFLWSSYAFYLLSHNCLSVQLVD